MAHYLINALGPISGKERTDEFLRGPFQVNELTGDSVSAAVEQLQRYAQLWLGGRDATILSTMKKYGASCLVTHDTAFKSVEWIDVVDPCG